MGVQRGKKIAGFENDIHFEKLKALLTFLQCFAY